MASKRKRERERESEWMRKDRKEDCTCLNHYHGYPGYTHNSMQKYVYPYLFIFVTLLSASGVGSEHLFKSVLPYFCRIMLNIWKYFSHRVLFFLLSLPVFRCLLSIPSMQPLWNIFHFRRQKAEKFMWNLNLVDVGHKESFMLWMSGSCM